MDIKENTRGGFMGPVGPINLLNNAKFSTSTSTASPGMSLESSKYFALILIGLVSISNLLMLHYRVW
jgi:hypothetical protein